MQDPSYMFPATRSLILIAIIALPPPPVSPLVFLGVADWRAFSWLLLVGRKMPTAIYIATVVFDCNPILFSSIHRLHKESCNGRLLAYDARDTLHYTSDDSGLETRVAMPKSQFT